MLPHNVFRGRQWIPRQQIAGGNRIKSIKNMVYRWHYRCPLSLLSHKLRRIRQINGKCQNWCWDMRVSRTTNGVETHTHTHIYIYIYIYTYSIAFNHSPNHTIITPYRDGYFSLNIRYKALKTPKLSHKIFLLLWLHNFATSLNHWLNTCMIDKDWEYFFHSCPF